MRLDIPSPCLGIPFAARLNGHPRDAQAHTGIGLGPHRAHPWHPWQHARHDKARGRQPTKPRNRVEPTVKFFWIASLPDPAPIASYIPED